MGQSRTPELKEIARHERGDASTAWWDGHKRHKGSKVHAAVDTLGQLLVLHVTPAPAQDGAQVAELAATVQAATGETVELAFVDQGYTRDGPRQAADHGVALEVVKLPQAKRDFGWLSRFRRLVRDRERLADVLRGFHLVAFSTLMCHTSFPSLRWCEVYNRL